MMQYSRDISSQKLFTIFAKGTRGRGHLIGSENMFALAVALGESHLQETMTLVRRTQPLSTHDKPS